MKTVNKTQRRKAALSVFKNNRTMMAVFELDCIFSVLYFDFLDIPVPA